jgi:hypothetical protein
LGRFVVCFDAEHLHAEAIALARRDHPGAAREVIEGQAVILLARAAKLAREAQDRELRAKRRRKGI